MMTLRLNRKTSRMVAVTFATIMLTNVLCPVTAWALTGGPSQPEVQSFEPIGTSDMVDVFSGDFNYNIPLLDMDGYPINIAYHSGITMDQEASWVGLGWNINPGVINRNVRGIPDDFDGDLVEHDFNMKPNRTFGVNGGFGTELFGYDKANINFSIGVKYNNYTGIGIEKSLNLSLTSGKTSSGKLTGGLGITSSSEEGLTIAPSLNYEGAMNKAKNLAGESSFGLSIGTCFNSRGGLKQLTIKSNLPKTGTPIDQAGFGTSSVFNFGGYTYTPKIEMPMQNFSITGSFKFGGELFGLHGNYTLGGYFSSQKLITNTVSAPAYGYMHYEDGERRNDAMLDFNRENDGAYTKDMPALPLASLTYDIYSVSGQGVGGSYRPFRSDIGYVYDAYNYSTSDGLSIGGELGVGNLGHIGADLSLNITNTTSGGWTSSNGAISKMKYTASSTDKAYEPFYFKEANEKSVDSDPALFSSYGGTNAERFYLNHISKFNTNLNARLVDKNGTETNLSSTSTRHARDKRNQVIYQLTRKEVNDGFGIDDAYPNSYAAPDHHIAEITTYGTDGMRYVYGLAAYNTEQDEVSFAVGKRLNGSGARTGDCVSGLVDYISGSNNTADNDLGLDNYYSKTKTPPFAHSYLLTEVLSPDYVDADTVKGPSVNDLGYYTKFFYSKIDNYKWRVPVQQDTATWNEGLRSDENDDKANYIYGTKDLWYLDSIVSKNYIAIFTKEARKDGCGVVGENGGKETSSSKAMKLLRKISLYSLHDYRLNGSNAVPQKEVHFEYDYSLCPNVPNNTGASETVNSINLNANKGKLTLKKIYFTYQNSNKARLSPYEFSYDSSNPSSNPSYNIKGYDRWGGYKPNAASCGTFAPLNTSEFPYVIQDQSLANTYSSSWNMREVKLPSGGKISITYESDDYAYVQNKRAMQMFKIIGVENNSGLMATNANPTDFSISDATNKNRRLYFEMQSGYTNVADYFSGIDKLYFRCLMSFDPFVDKHDYVSGYAQIAQYGDTVISGTTVGWVRLQPVKLKDSGGSDYNPVTKAAIQFGRMNLSRFINNQPGMTGDESFGENVLTAIINSSFVENIKDAIEGPNKAIWDDNKGTSLVIHKSWLRLNNPSHKKFGGGSRVKKITMSDEFNTLTGGDMNSFQYGQEYDYTLEDGTSSGVATYEPQLGGDENPWKQPITFTTDNLLAPDDEHYVEEPLGESFFPGASVGYSRVTVKNLQYSNVNRNATGKVVHEFYTARDFPTIVDRTSLEHIQDKTDPFSITSVLFTNTRDHLTATQGFTIELNDMHGKPKQESVYQEGQATPITSVSYIYQSTPYGTTNSFRLDNNATVISKLGNVSTAQIGVFYDVAADMREQYTQTTGLALQMNVDAFIVPPLPVVLPVPMIWPSLSSEETQFRSATMTKVIQRFGILKEVTAQDLGSIVKTQNLAYDAETGELLVTSATTDFNDTVYSLTYPAHWYYNEMGQAYRNIGLKMSSLSFASGVSTVINALSYFVPGDELEMNGGIKTWVTNVSANSITVEEKDGTLYSGTSDVKVIRSGRKNLATTPVSTVSSRSNPLDHFHQNIFDNVLQASAAEYSDQWRTFCDCFDEPNMPSDNSTNPYVLGILGNWRLKRSLLFLSSRTQSNYDNNTNIRKDGVFTSFTPYYKLQNNNWAIDEHNWTFTSEVTEFSPYGAELENKDALGRYSAATFGYKQTLATAVAANARYRDIGADNFEDYGFSTCADNHFKFTGADSLVKTDVSHTGRYSMLVHSGTPVIMNKNLSVCEPAGCTLSTDTSSTVDQFTVTITGGTAPFQMEWNVISGDPQVTFSGMSINITGSSWTIEVIVTDAKGCKTSRIVTKSGGVR